MEDDPIHCVQSLEEIEALGLKKGDKVCLPPMIRMMVDVSLLEEQIRRDRGKLVRAAILGFLSVVGLVTTWFTGDLFASFGFSLATCCAVCWFFHVHHYYSKFNSAYEGYVQTWLHLRSQGFDVIIPEEGEDDGVPEVPL